MTNKAREALREIEAHADDSGDGDWFEELVRVHGAAIGHWNVDAIHYWREWPGRTTVFPDSSPDDIAIDLVAEDAAGKRLIAIQCKARREGSAINLDEVDGFLSAAAAPEFKEAWIVGTTGPSEGLRERLNNRGLTKVRCLRLQDELLQSAQAAEDADPDPRDEIQRRVIDASLKGLENVRGRTHEGWRATDARGRIVMPCGTGKTRVGYRIARELTTPGKTPDGADRLTIVLCPSIGLVRQLKTAYEAMAKSDGVEIDTLAVCSDRSGDSARRRRPNVDEAIADDPTADLSGIDGSEITGAVRRKAQDIADWITVRDRDPAAWPVIVSTYQSGPTLAEGVRHAGADAAVLICDEAHRTAGLKKTPKANEATLRNFTVCHDNALLPARNRLYMTATPKTFTRGTAEARDEGYVVVSMNDEATFGPNLAEVSYREAVEQEALTDYRIAAIVPHNESYEFADKRARKHARDAKKKQAEGASARQSGDRSTSILVRQIAYGTALAAGIDEGDGGERLAVPSSIAFCNRTRTSREMAEELNDPAVRKHIAGVTGQGTDGPAKRYEVHHRDATSRAGARHTALTKLAGADPENPVGISNVGIFGEGIDTPDLAAIAFIEPRKGPIDVIQAVGRVMRRSEAKNIGLILVPLEIPLDEDAEAWLESRTSENQFKELGQILQALRAHDARIEDRLQHLLKIYEPSRNGRAEKTGYHLLTTSEPEGVKTYVAIGRDGVIENALAEADRKTTVAQLLERAADKVTEVTKTQNEASLPEKPRSTWVADCRRRSKPKIAPVDVSAAQDRRESDDRYPVAPIAEAQRTLLNGAIVDKRKGRNQNTVFLRAPVRREPARPGGGKTPASHGLLGCILENNERGRSIRMRILRNSGLKTESERHMDVLYSTVERAAGKLKADDLEEQLAALLKMDRTTAVKGEQGNACMVAALVLTVAVLVQTRLEVGEGLRNIDVEPLAEIGTSPRPAENLERAFNRILQHDYEAVFTLARDILCDVTQAGRKTAMLDEAVAGIIEQSRDAAEQYATAGADYAGELFNRIMHDRASDGAYFTRPEAGALLAGLALHATEETDFTNGNIVDRLRVLDPACGSGTLLQAWLTAIKRKARDNGATDAVLSRMHRRIVEDALTGLDVNPVSIQLAGAMLMIGDTRVQYARMGLRTMPYGLQKAGRTAAAGSLELLRQPDVLAHQGGKTDAARDDFFFDDELNSFAPPEATERALKTRVVLTNPPFVTRGKLGAKFGVEVQRAIRERIDKSQQELENKLPSFVGFSEKTTTQPLYLALGLLAIDPETGVLGTMIPTAGLLAPSGLAYRRKLASDLQIRYVVSSHERGQENFSQSFDSKPVNESLVVGTRTGRNDGLATTFVSLDRFPRNQVDAHALADAIATGGDIEGQRCQISNERMRNGDWSAAGWRNLKLDEAAQLIDRHPMLKQMCDIPGVTMRAPGHGAFTP
ncbi:MAG: DEAD/DEAH box helicase family protein, partial [Acidobacteria bacterium]|nr:DEAD/DEAH box helicase family protein [Acidobacteriota bacterium]